jgi:PAS domain S-box-containing protein
MLLPNRTIINLWAAKTAVGEIAFRRRWHVENLYRRVAHNRPQRFSFALPLVLLLLHPSSVTARVLSRGFADLTSRNTPKLFPRTTQLAWGQLTLDLSDWPLPLGNIVSFQAQAFWEQYSWYVIVVTVASIIEGLLIAWLLLARRRRTIAEQESERFARLARKEDQHLNEVVANVPGIVWEATTHAATGQRKTTFISGYLQKMLGYTPEEWLAEPPGFGLRIMADEDRERAAHDSEAVATTGKNGVSQFRLKAKDNRWVWAESYLSPIVDEDGKITGLRGVTLDITDRKLAEESLLKSESKNRAILQALPDLVFVQDENGVFLDYHCKNPEDLFVSPDKFLGKNMRDVLPLQLAENLAECFARARKTGDPQVLEYQLTVGSAARWYEARMVSNGSTNLSLVRDITERMLVQQELRESEKRFRTLADMAPVMIWMSDQNKLGTYFNEQWLHFVGKSLDQASGNGWVEAVHPEDRARLLEVYETSFDERKRFEMEYRLRRMDGEYRWVFDSGRPRFSADGEFLGYIGSAIDITERKESEVALRHAHEELSQLKTQLEAENIYLQQELDLDQALGEIVGHSDAIKYVLSKINVVAATDSTVLVTGETGTGKELIARAIHTSSSRKERSLIKVNCAALPGSLIESELFGYEKGAFTGALVRKLGRFELADGGTIFLDEIGELPLESQVKLLRVIQEGEFERIGGTKTIKVDVRIIAATNRNLKLESEKGTFREDLWYRLNVFPITAPPLRQRREDIPLLVEHFVNKYAKRFGKAITSVSPRTLQSLQSHTWPGNVRELANIIERAVIHTQGPVLHLAEPLGEMVEDSASHTQSLEEIERTHIINILENTGWRIEGPNGAAKLLGLNASTLRARMVKLGIQRPRATAAISPHHQ